MQTSLPCYADQLKCKEVVRKASGVSARVPLNQGPYKGLTARLKSRVRSAVRSTGLFDLERPSFWKVSDRSQSSESESLAVSVSHIVMDVMNASERERLAQAIENPKLRNIDLALPPSFLNRVYNASATFREDFCKEIRSTNAQLARSAIQMQVVALYSDLAESSIEYMEVIREWDEFYGFSRPISEVVDNGHISLPKLLREKMHREPGSTSPAFVTRSVAEKDIHGILFAVVKNAKSNGLELRIDLAVDSETLYKPTSHALAAQGAEVVYAGEIFVNELGQIEAVNLNSGHYMYGRDRGIASGLRIQAQKSGIPFSQLKAAAYEIDELNIKELFQNQFHLEFSKGSVFGRHIFARNEDWSLIESKFGDEEGEILPIIHRREFARYSR